MPKDPFHLTNAMTLLDTAKRIWANFETHENISGRLKIALKAEAPLHQGQMKIEWELVYYMHGEPYTSHVITGQDLLELARECISRVLRDKRNAPLMIGRDQIIENQLELLVPDDEI